MLGRVLLIPLRYFGHFLELGGPASAVGTVVEVAYITRARVSGPNGIGEVR